MDQTRAAHFQKHVLVLAYYVPPLGMSGVQRVSKLLKYLPQFGWRCTLIAPHPGGYFAYDESLLDDIQRSGVTVHRTPSVDPTRLVGKREVGLANEQGRRRLSNASQYVFIPDNKIGWLPFALNEARKVIANDRPDAIFSSAPPYTAHLASSLLSALYRIPFLADFRDDWLENPRHVYPTSVHREIQRRLERWVVRRANGVTTINSVIADSLAERSQRDVRVIRQGFDPADFPQQPRVKGACCKLTYTGVFYDAQKPDTFLRGVRQFLDRRPDAKVRLEFAGSLPHDAQSLAARLDLEEIITFHGYLPHSEVVRLQAESDVLWMTIGRRPGSECISTGKLFEYIGAARPVLALVPDGAARDVLSTHGAAFLCDPDDAGEVAQALYELYAQWERGALPVVRTEYRKQYDRRLIAGEIADMLSTMANSA
jgi:glycosyltransferase involved in cell wall biosynthesis